MRMRAHVRLLRPAGCVAIEMVSALLLVVCSTIFHHTLYQALKLVLIRRLVEPLLKRWHGNKSFSLSDGDVAHLSVLCVSFTNGLVGGVCSVIIVWQAREDFLLGDAPLLLPCTHWIAHYMIYDFYAMYDADYLRKGINRFPQFTTRMKVFFKKRWSMLLHHALLLGCGYPLVAFPQIRNYKGDFAIGMFYMREIWNPFQNLAQILKMVKLDTTTLYYVNGVALVLVQLVVRVLNWPFVIVVYAAQYHAWGIVAAVRNLYTLCIVSTTVWQVLEFYWFWLILHLAAGFTRQKKE